ncbi:hypothetical protein SAMN05428974_2640 [Sphingopyxis sp. YR583]|uniref:hypothetical protein n=1 Tax=Sphingopyxis sp. YR583 TaxID=1881047 RepID=UPI0008A81276|nr:hypothetical protein [Sphingopyxis sp. YR583]SEH18407.1 hypothetical protein SAMN05428974_2640 [Sphingopyxis sp. YR583]
MSLFAWVMMIAVQGGGEPLPAKTDIPSDYSTVICPNETAAREMLGTYYSVQPAPRNHTIDTSLFFKGLAATGCTQNSPDAKSTITIQQALQRRTLTLAPGRETYLVYRGVNASGAKLVGIVDETGNAKHPRTDFERWLAEFIPDGVLDHDPASTSKLYLCATTDGARAAVRAIPAKGKEAPRNAAFAKARTANGCRDAAAGRYKVTARYENRTISCGFECEDVWNALAATDARGQPVALIFNGSHF